MTSVVIPSHGDLGLPEDLLLNLRAVHGDRLDAWLAELPAILSRTLDDLDATIAPGEPPLSYHLVLFARRANGDDIVIKCTVPNAEQPPELAAVHALSDAGIGPRLIVEDLERGVLVMARVRPGEMLPRGMPSIEDDARITYVMATLATRMARDVPLDAWAANLVPVRRYTRALETVDRSSALWRVHRREIERAVELRDTMLREQPPVFLHGDLQHHNVLRDAQDRLWTIDPKGLIGPAGYEFGALTYNPPWIQDHPDLSAIERQRIDIWSDVTGLPWETVRAWGYVAAVLSACWSAVGGVVHWRDAMAIARTIQAL